MKKLILGIICLLCYNAIFAQDETETTSKWNYGIGIHFGAFTPIYTINEDANYERHKEPQIPGVGFGLSIEGIYKINKNWSLQTSPIINFISLKSRLIDDNNIVSEINNEFVTVDFPFYINMHIAQQRFYFGGNVGFILSDEINDNAFLRNYQAGIIGGYGYDFLFKNFKMRPFLQSQFILSDIYGNTNNNINRMNYITSSIGLKFLGH